MYGLPSRRARREGSLAAAVGVILDDFQCPVSTTAMRVVLNDRGREVTAEHLGRLAAYQREDFLRTRYPPELCWALAPDGTAVKPRWWARGTWRLQRRILTKDVHPIWTAILAERLCFDLAERPDNRGRAIVSLALGSVSQVVGRSIELPTSGAEWVDLRTEVYEQHLGVFGNLAGATFEQQEAERRLQGEGLSAFDLLFGRAGRPARSR